MCQGAADNCTSCIHGFGLVGRRCVPCNGGCAVCELKQQDSATGPLRCTACYGSDSVPDPVTGNCTVTVRVASPCGMGGDALAE